MRPNRLTKRMIQMKLIRMRRCVESLKKRNCQTSNKYLAPNLRNHRGPKRRKIEEAKEPQLTRLASILWKLVYWSNRRSNWPYYNSQRVNKKREENNLIKFKVTWAKRTRQATQIRKRINKTVKIPQHRETPSCSSSRTTNSQLNSKY